MTAFLRILLALAALTAALVSYAQDVAVVVIAHPGVGAVDASTLQKLYTGRAIEVASVPVTVVNTAPGSPARERFMAQVLATDSDRYVAYWTVRRHVGKGVPPRELKSSAEVVEFVQNTPGGLGYIPAADVRPGLNIVFKPQ